MTQGAGDREKRAMQPDFKPAQMHERFQKTASRGIAPSSGQLRAALMGDGGLI